MALCRRRSQSGLDVPKANSRFPTAALLSNLEKYHKKKRCPHRLQQHETDKNLCFRPPPVMPKVIVQRISDFFEDPDLEETEKPNFEDTCSTIYQHNTGNNENQDRVPTGQNQHAE